MTEEHVISPVESAPPVPPQGSEPDVPLWLSTKGHVDTITYVGWIGEVGVRAGAPGLPRRRWSEAVKRRIVAESCQPGPSVSVVARRDDVDANLVLPWRRRLCGREFEFDVWSGPHATLGLNIDDSAGEMR